MRNPYTCIFKRTLQTRIWSLSPTTRCVWLWMKLQADPEGYVNADLAGVAAGANVTPDEARRAIEGFVAPDPDADPDDPHEGRVLERVRGGWLILDHESERELAKTETRNARNAKYARARRARERQELEQQAHDDLVARLNRSTANDVAPPSVPADAPVAPYTPRSKPTTKPTTTVAEDSNSNPPTPLGPVVVVSARIDKLPEDWAPSAELRAEATMAGVTDLDERIADLRLGPIGGSRGVFPDKVDDYIRKQFPRWKTWGETDRAKARAAAAAPPSSRRLFVPPAPEPKAKHKRVAERWGIPLAPIIAELAERKIVETLGTDAWHEHLERAIAKQAAAIRDGRAA